MSLPLRLSSAKRRLPQEVNAPAIYSHLFERLRSETSLGGILDEAQWARMTEPLLKDARLPPCTPSRVSAPFTDTLTFLSELVSDHVEDIGTAEDHTKRLADSNSVFTLDDPPVDRYAEASASLTSNPLWVDLFRHSVQAHGASCRSVTHLVVIAAIRLAQDELARHEELDIALAQRHYSEFESEPTHKCEAHPGSGSARNWVVLHQNLDVPAQNVLPQLELHGILDYLVGVVPANEARVELHRNVNVPIMASSLFPGTTLANELRQGFSSILEAKSESTLSSTKFFAQAIGQGAAMCTLGGRACVITTLTDGIQWQFLVVEKAQAEAGQKRARASTSLAPPASKRRTSSRLKASASSSRPDPVLQEVPVPLPFRASRTRLFDISRRPRDLAIVLRLLVLSFIEKPESFKALVAGR
ncbi:hypothetical protein C8R46DRAFT_1124559 [Mycena filopes]|nr:hypothetical protein C8R46DRAFT_1124559 [Mycena filopes]